MIKCYRDADGHRRVDPRDVHPLISAYLEQDVQGSRETCRKLLRILDAVASDSMPEWSGTGNAHTVTIRRDGVDIVNEWDDSLGEAHLTLDEFRRCLQEWTRFLES